MENIRVLQIEIKQSQMINITILTPLPSRTTMWFIVVFKVINKVNSMSGKCAINNVISVSYLAISFITHLHLYHTQAFNIIM